MKRRSILGSLGSMGLIGVAGAANSTSLYGTPVSVSGPISKTSNEPLKLLLGELNLPSKTIPLMAQYGQIWDKVLGNEIEKKKFHHDPAGYLRENGIPPSILESRDQEVLLLKALSDDNVISAAISGEYKEFLESLVRLGVTSQTSKSGLKKKVAEILMDKKEEISSKFSSKSIENLRSESANEIVYLYSQLAPSIDQVAVAAVPVAIAAIAVVYVSVGAVVTVGVLGGVYVSIAVATAITVGTECVLDTQTDLYAGPASSNRPQLGRTERQRRMQHAIAQRELIGKRMMILSPERLQEAQQTARLARLMSNNEFALQANRQLVKDEVEIFIEAAEEVGLLKIPIQSRGDVLSSLQRIALRAAALE